MSSQAATTDEPAIPGVLASAFVFALGFVKVHLTGSDQRISKIL
jgi:hypothetical protein